MGEEVTERGYPHGRGQTRPTATPSEGCHRAQGLGGGAVAEDLEPVEREAAPQPEEQVAGPAPPRRPWRGRPRPPARPRRTGSATRPRRRWHGGGPCGRRPASDRRRTAGRTPRTPRRRRRRRAPARSARPQPDRLLGVDPVDGRLLRRPPRPEPGPLVLGCEGETGRSGSSTAWTSATTSARPTRYQSRALGGRVGEHPVGPGGPLHRARAQDHAGPDVQQAHVADERGRVPPRRGGHRGPEVSLCSVAQGGALGSTIPAQSKVTVPDATYRLAGGPTRKRRNRRHPAGGSLTTAATLRSANVAGFFALAAGSRLELHAVALAERAVAVTLDVGVVNEDVVADLAGDETEAPLVAEELHGTCRHDSHFGSGAARIGRLRLPHPRPVAFHVHPRRWVRRRSSRWPCSRTRLGPSSGAGCISWLSSCRSPPASPSWPSPGGPRPGGGRGLRRLPDRAATASAPPTTGVAGPTGRGGS